MMEVGGFFFEFEAVRSTQVPNMLMMTVISFFFSGFVLVKVPFPVTQRFKQMLQRGVDLATLDTSYVSSLSWYFLLMFGLRGFLRVVLGEDPDAMDANREMQMQMGMGQCINQIVATRLHHGSIMAPTPSTRRRLDGVPLGVFRRSIRSARSRFRRGRT